MESLPAAAADVARPGVPALRGTTGDTAVLLQAALELADVTVAAAVHVQVRLSNPANAIASRSTPVNVAGLVSAVAAHHVAGSSRIAERCHELSGGWRCASAREWRQQLAASHISAAHVDRANGVFTLPIAKFFWTVLTTLSAVTISISFADQ